MKFVVICACRQVTHRWSWRRNGPGAATKGCGGTNIPNQDPCLDGLRAAAAKVIQGRGLIVNNCNNQCRNKPPARIFRCCRPGLNAFRQTDRLDVRQTNRHWTSALAARQVKRENLQ